MPEHPPRRTEDDPSRGDDGAARPRRSVLDLERPYRQRIPDSSVANVRRVARLDGRTRIVAAREPGGTWYRLSRSTRFTREEASVLRSAQVSEVVLRRGLGRASFPLGWLTTR